MNHACPFLATMLLSVVVIAQQPESETVKQPSLRSELLNRFKRDQEARRAFVEWTRKNGRSGTEGLSPAKQAEWKALSARVISIDADNTAWLKTVLQQHGWPGKSLIGADGANAASVFVQHADAEPKFQRMCLNLMMELPKEEIEPRHIAYLTDRVLLAEGKKQLYGTQFLFENGKLFPRPIEDEANVDHRRAAVGLPSLSEYVKLLERQLPDP